MEYFLHVCRKEKFIQQFIDLVNECYPNQTHLFYIYGNTKYSIIKQSGIIITSMPIVSLRGNSIIQNITNVYCLLKLMNGAKKIFIHGFWDYLPEIMLLNINLLKKTYWGIYGNDLYSDMLPNRKKNIGNILHNFFKRIIYKHIKYLMSYVYGDYLLAQKWYKTNGIFIENIMYPSCFYKEISYIPSKAKELCILLGNSADPSNNHKEVLEKLLKYKNYKIIIYAPLSYGEIEYAKEIAEYGQKLFGNKFIPLFDFMAIDEYNKLLSKIDIAIFAHKRQQAMGNIITLLGLKKMVFIRKNISSYDTLKRLNLQVFDYDKLEIPSKGQLPHLENNKKIVKEYFSKENALSMMNKIFI